MEDWKKDSESVERVWDAAKAFLDVCKEEGVPGFAFIVHGMTSSETSIRCSQEECICESDYVDACNEPRVGVWDDRTTATMMVAAARDAACNAAGSLPVQSKRRVFAGEVAMRGREGGGEQR